MTEEFVVRLGQDALTTMLLVSAPILGLGLIVGLLVSIFQATTQIQEQSLSFIPKILAVLGSIVVFGPWMLGLLLDFTRNLYVNIPQVLR